MPKEVPVPKILRNLKAGEFGLSFEDDGLRAKVRLELKSNESRGLIKRDRVQESLARWGGVDQGGRARWLCCRSRELCRQWR